MKKLLFIYNYLLYRLNAVNEHDVHSPFVYDLLTKVFYSKADYYSFKKIEHLREQLLDSKKIIATHGSKSAKYGQLLFRLVNYIQPPQVIELGTSAGINTAYMASVSSKINIVTVEGRKEIAEIARENFKNLELKNITQIINNFDAALANVLVKCEHLDFVFFSENYSKHNTLGYFSQCLEKVNGESVFIFDNIYSSKEMKETWNEIKNNKHVMVTIDLFFMGIVFFRKEQVKQHFVIKF